MSSLNWITEYFGTDKAVVGMVHVQALPGTPFASRSMENIIAQAVAESRTLANAGVDAILLENMHDRPYLRQQVGPEIVAAMTAVSHRVRESAGLPTGIQILAGANREALAVAAMTGACFIRAENFIFAHVADEGLMDQADAGPLLRYRREIGAEHVRILADIKKKHAAHALTADVSIAEGAEAAVLFGADAVIVTGSATARPTDVNDMIQVRSAVEVPVAVGSGITPDNLPDLWEPGDVFIVGSFIKQEGQWHRSIDPDRLAALMRVVKRLRQ
ncbi:MAG: BtpA/SgcQ family protein [Phycisphaerales bacterium]|nr:BtpA/SgcQ family protein [Phycisphaerales bacterium]